jgi:hypothetical protein
VVVEVAVKIFGNSPQTQFTPTKKIPYLVGFITLLNGKIALRETTSTKCATTFGYARNPLQKR